MSVHKIGAFVFVDFNGKGNFLVIITYLNNIYLLFLHNVFQKTFIELICSPEQQTTEI